jgi:hypothetical protein
LQHLLTISYLQEIIFKNMKNYSDVIGIDVSKLTIDAHIHNSVIVYGLLRGLSTKGSK